MLLSEDGGQHGGDGWWQLAVGGGTVTATKSVNGSERTMLCPYIICTQRHTYHTYKNEDILIYIQTIKTRQQKERKRCIYVAPARRPRPQPPPPVAPARRPPCWFLKWMDSKESVDMQ